MTTHLRATHMVRFSEVVGYLLKKKSLSRKTKEKLVLGLVDRSKSTWEIGRSGRVQKLEDQKGSGNSEDQTGYG